MRIGRREFVRWSAAAFVLGPAPPPPHPSPFQEEGGRRRTRLILLGTGGGPSPKRLRSAPAQVILVGDDAYVVDCGDGVARQMALAGVALSRIRAVFVTHHHSDHNADYGNLLLLGWIDGLKPIVDAYGPPPLAKMTGLIAEMNAADIATRIGDEGRPPFTGLVVPHEITAGGPGGAPAGAEGTAAPLDPPPLPPAFGYPCATPPPS